MRTSPRTPSCQPSRRRWGALGFVAVLNLLNLGGCTGLQTVTHAPDEPDQPARREPVWRYGNFCGLHHPDLPPDLPVQEEVRQLLAIQPVDDVDLTCQFHDVCYVINGQPSRTCDQVLSWNLKLITPSISKVRKDLHGYFGEESPRFLDGCTRLISEIEHYAEVSAALNAEEVSDMLRDGLGGVVSAVVSSPALLLGDAIGRTQLVAGASLSACVTAQEPALLFPISKAELGALRRCYSAEAGFANCAPNTVTARGRSNQHTAEAATTLSTEPSR
jgi:hypothetical protein